MVDQSRRNILRTIGGGGLAVLSGCLFGGSTKPGSIVLRNNGEDRIIVDVTVTKVSDDSDDTGSFDEERGDDVEPIWVREYEYEVAGGSNHVDDAVIDEPGAYYVEATTNTDESDSNWLGLYEARNGIAEDYIYVSISENGRPTISMTHSD